eukprot:GHVN01077073.1.p1 GENE.GHVN01077073.1~~GHVN01077073.1.p1  ORF type:complete len:134 (-),score=6.29 GHVN01077073.1:95-496(-)
MLKIIPVIENCLPAWWGVKAGSRDRVEGVQRRMLRLIYGFHLICREGRETGFFVNECFLRSIRQEVRYRVKTHEGHAKKRSFADLVTLAAFFDQTPDEPILDRNPVYFTRSEGIANTSQRRPLLIGGGVERLG